MASLIPKIKIGLAQNRKEKHNLSFDCSTTANIGSIQPTMCREMVPNEKFKVKVNSLVRLASMPLPTFGRMSLRHYHSFIPYIDLWQPFDAMMAGQHYQGVNSQNFIPTSTPYFTMHDIQQWIIDYSIISIAPSDDIDHPYTLTTNHTAWDGTVYDTTAEAQAADLARVQTAWSAIRASAAIFGGQSKTGIFTRDRGGWLDDQYGCLALGSAWANPKYNTDTLAFGTNVWYAGGITPVTPQGADLITVCGGYTLLMKFKAPLKRLRQIFIGLGYQFSPYNQDNLSAMKLLAYYKAWFSLFRPNREKTFVDTSCYALIKKSSEKNGVNLSSGLGDVSLWRNFIDDLIKDCYYYLPMDYFSMAVLRPDNSNQDTDFIMNARPGVTTSNPIDDSNDNVTVKTASTVLSQQNVVGMQGTGPLSPLTIKLAMRMLTWANKNTVLGRSIREYLKVHFGVTDTMAIDDDAVYRIGSSRTNIEISDVMSTAENSQGFLGEYAGKGIGFGKSETFDFTADKFGCWITFTVVVPESGYFQGYLKENKHLNRYQFFNPEFDALGYQVLERGEIMDDYNCDSPTWNPLLPQSYVRSGAFGFVPRYSEYKVGRNIVNGDLSLAGLYNSMAGYTLDRRISAGVYKAGEWVTEDGAFVRQKMSIGAPSFIPSVVYDNFRRIDPTDHLGQYNRIFNVVTNDLDHFIIHNVFDVTAYAPMKSLSNSFDTVSKEDDGSIDVTHS